MEFAVRRFRPIMPTVATVLTLLFLPAIYAAWHRVGRPSPMGLRGVGA